MNVRGLFLSIIVASGGFVAGTSEVRADAVEIDQDPLFLVPPVKPALVMAVDDSGSMDSEILLDANDGALWWDSDNDSFTGLGSNASGTGDVPAPGRLNFNTSGGNNSRWQKYTYVFPNGSSNNDGRRLGLSDHHGVPPIPEFAFARSPEFNSIYFNPAIEYPPWPSEGSQQFSDADEAAAQADPERGSQTWNLKQTVKRDDRHWTFTFYRGMTIPAGTEIKEADDDACSAEDIPEDWAATTQDIEIKEDDCEVAVAYYPATFWLKETTPEPAGFVGTPLTGGKAPDGSPMVGYEITPSNFSNYDEMMQRFANWFQYYRKRTHLTRAAMGRSFVDTEFLRLGFTTINSRDQVTMRDMEIDSDRKAYFDWQYELEASGGTTNKQAVKHIGDEFANRTGDDAPIIEACQRNFGMLVTDGFSNPWGGAGVGNTDGPSAPTGEPEAFASVLSDSEDNTMADIAYNYYKNALRTDLGDAKLTVDSRCYRNGDPDQGLDPNRPVSLNCRDDLHMNLFAVTLGAKGLLFGRDEDAMADPWNNLSSSDWPTDFPTRHPNAVDDIWHATLNTRGEMFTATRPDELVDVLSAVLSEIAARIQPVGISASASRVDEDSLFFESSLNSSRWSGDLRAVSTEDQKEQWTAQEQMPRPSNRNIFTTVGEGATTFARGNATLKNRMFGTESDLSEAEKNAIIDYLRGERDDEIQNGGTLRDRDGALGDIANSRPVFAGPRNEGWGRLDKTYLDYLDDVKKDRTPVVLVGANDGMLHAFDGSPEGGQELFAYVPSMVHENLPELAEPDYVHRFFVDGQITVADAKPGSSWKTVAVGGLGGGGKGIFALDITNPTSFGSGDVLWELDADDDGDIGHVYDEPLITRLPDGEWVVIFANGFNSDDDQAHLFIVDLGTGEVKQKIALGDAGDNGLASSAALIDPQSRLFTRRVYAGDLQGNVWAVEFNDTGTGSSRFGANKPLINVGRPVVAPPILAPNPGGGLMVYFGTGKLIETTDRLQTDPPLEQFFAVRDRGNAFNSLNSLAVAEVTGSGANRSVTTSGDVSDGWRLELADGSASGERVLARPQVVFGQLIFSTFEPQADICEALGIPRIYVLDALSGRGLLDQRCQNCGSIELGAGGPVDPAVILRPAARDPDSDLIGDGDGDGDGEDGGEDNGSLEVGRLDGWCSEILLLVPGEGFVSIGRLCDGRQVWRQVR